MKKYILGTLIIIAGIFTASAASAQDLVEYKFNRDLIHGSGGNDVVMMKFCLNHIADTQAEYETNGYFSSKTVELVKNFQKSQGLFVDGKLGKKTGTKLEQLCNGDVVKTQKNNSLVTVSTDLNKNDAEIDFSFKLKNTTKNSIVIDGMNAFKIALDGTSMSLDSLDSMDAFDVDLSDNKGKELKKGYAFNTGDKKEFTVSIDVDADKLENRSKSFDIRLLQLNWDLNGKSKILKLGSSSEKISF